MENKVLSVKDSAFAFGFGFLICQLAVFIFSLLGTIICSMAKIDTANFSAFLNNSYGYLLTVIIFNSAIVGVFIYFNKGKQNEIVSKPKPLKLLLYVLIATVSFFCLSPIINCIDSLLVKCGVRLNTISYELTPQSMFVSVFSLAIIPAVCEELLFRGLIFKGLKSAGKAFSIIVSALMFCIFHMSVDQTAYPLLIGLLLAVIMYYENNILYCIALHLTNNLLSLITSYFNLPLYFSHWSYILMAVVLCIVFVSVVLYFTFKNNKNTKSKIDKENLGFLVGSIAIMIVLWFIINFNR